MAQTNRYKWATTGKLQGYVNSGDDRIDKNLWSDAWKNKEY